jgi:hypothetical protein
VKELQYSFVAHNRGFVGYYIKLSPCLTINNTISIESCIWLSPLNSKKNISAFPVNLPQTVEKFSQMSIPVPGSAGNFNRETPPSQGIYRQEAFFNSVWQGILTKNSGKRSFNF